MPTSEVLADIDLSGCPLLAFANIALLLEEEGGREILEAAAIKQKLNQTVTTDTPAAQAQGSEPQVEVKTHSQKRAGESLGSLDNDVQEIKSPKRKSKAKEDDTQKVTRTFCHELFPQYVASFPKFPKNATVEARRQALLADPSVGDMCWMP